MAIQLKPLGEQVIVITGASSGIGLATAMAAAGKGARLVLAARNEEALKKICDKINAAGGEAIAVAADVGERVQVQHIADTANERFGGFDTWVNDAGVSLYGRLEEVSDADHHRLFDTNFWGLVYGSQIAAMHLRHRGGALINLGSIASDIALPLQGMYSASKHAIKGFTDAFRLELEQEGAPISVTLIKPSSIATPFNRHAKNCTGQEPTLPPPMYQPEDVAHAILHAASHPVRDIYVGGGGKVMSAFNKNFPSAMDWMSRKTMFALQKRDEPAKPHPEGFRQAGEGGHMYGEYPHRHIRRSWYTRAALHPVVTGLIAAAAGAATVALVRGVQHRSGARP
ncbi:MAG TPA: SDR family oxidoreductase [Rhodanobacteraceae bacterium]|nr:SDR family oxidoreductase [Rhodanobacteraceae bacterium]